VASEAQVSVFLSVEETQTLLQEVPQAYRTQINDILVTALVQSLANWIHSPRFLIDLEGHGREELFVDVDLSRTVGWFTSIFPAFLDLGTVSNSPGEDIKSIKEQLHHIPNKGLGYGLLKYLNSEVAEQLQALPQAEILFNYLGQFQQILSDELLLGDAPESSGPARSPLGKRQYLFEINSSVQEGQLQVSWAYSTNLHQRTLVEQLAQNFITALSTLIKHCQSPDAGGYTPSDFSLANLAQGTLDQIVANNRQVADIYPLSPMQQGLLFHTIYSPDSGVYFEQLNMTIDSALNVLVFQQAWQQVIERYSVLRTAFVWEGVEQPLQIVYSQVELPWTQLDWQNFTTDEQQEKLATFLSQDQAKGFELDKVPLMRVTLIQLATESYQFVWSYHHLLLDGWCFPILLKDVLDFYKAGYQKQTLHLPQPRPYRDYIAWLEQQDFAKAKAFWQEQLRGFTAPTPFRVDKHSHPTDSENDEEQIFLSKDVTEALQSLARQHHITLNSIIQGTWALLLSRYSGETDIVFGATVSGRPTELANVETMVGLFINTLPVRVQVSSKALLLPWLQQLQALQFEREPYSYTPLFNIQNWSEVTGGIPLFESLVVFENYPVKSALKDAPTAFLNVTQFHLIEKTNYPLTLIVVPASELRLKISYDCARFEANTINRMMGHIKTLLEGMIANPEKKLGDLSLLTKTECHQLVTWNQTETDYPKNQTIVDLFQTQVEKTPDNIAVVFEQQTLNYQILNTKANQLAHYLITLGVGTETLVGICAERSIEMIIGLLGILKAGGVYVPLDPDYPKERLHFMLEDSNVAVLLSQSHLLSRLPTTQKNEVFVVCLDSEWEKIVMGRCKENPVNQSLPDNLAYIIYTSGSTGKPKGVSIPHVAVVRLVKNTDYIHIDKNDCIAQASNTSFDAATFEIWGSLLNGAKLVGVSKDVALSPNKLAQHLRTHRINTLFLTTALFNQIAQTRPDCFGILKTLLFGGEQVDPYWVTTVLDNSPPKNLLHVYGPTESTTFASWYLIKVGKVNASMHTIPIGKPIANTQIYILDENHNPTPPGIPGELCIGGHGLARDYFKRPELTAKKFIEVELFSKTERIYKTGDLVKWRLDGNLEFLGRLDNQIKLRGFRIELGEIEAALSQHETVKEVVVVLYNQEDYPRLVAYITLIMPLEDVANILRTWLKTRLPEYMLPANFMVLDELPLTPNGKINRKALPTPDLSVQVEQQVPRTETEHLLCNLWSQVLGIEVTSSLSNFFETGGHSLLATQLVSRIRESFGIEMPLRIIFELPQLQEQSEWLDNEQRGLKLPPIMPLASGESLVWSFAQQRLWFLAQLEGQSATYNMPAALHLSGQLHDMALQRALIALIQRHESLRLYFPDVDGDALVQRGKVYNPLNITDLSELTETKQQQQVIKWITKHAQTPFDLSTGPLLNLRLLKLDKQEHILLFNMHHIISDGWSMAVLVRDWSQLYSDYAQHKESQLSKLPIQYTDFAAWQRNWLQGDVLGQQLAYWTDKLTGIPELLELPTDYPRPAVMTYQGQHLKSTLALELTRRIKQLSQQHGVTIFMTLLTAFKVLLSRYSGQTDLVVGSPIANRTHHQTEDLIGFFVNTLVLRTQIEEKQTFLELLKKVRQTALEAYSHQDIPFEYLVEQLNPSRSLSHSPLFQVMFVLQNLPEEALELSGLTMSFLEPEQTTAKFDLTLSVAEADDILVCDWEYNIDLFYPDTITKMTEHFQVLLEGILNNSKQSVFQLPLLTEAEQQQLLAWNQTQTDYPFDKTIIDLFQVQVEKTPKNTALIFEDQTLNYQELNIKANQLAHYLMTLGVGAETLVGICIERSVEMVIGLLGILKAGGAYVPFDPDYPEQRLQFMLEDSQVPVLLSQNHLVERLPNNQAQVVYLDKWDKMTTYSRANPVRQSGPENLAYVIYTSGSTGKPKGAMNLNQAICNRLLWMQDAYQLTVVDNVLQKTPFSFDVSVWEFFWPLLVGARLTVAKPGGHKESSYLVKLIEQEKITTLHFVPSMLQVFLQESTLKNCHSLKRVICSGEALPLELQARFFDTLPTVELHNLYGPTEAAVDVTYWACQSDNSLNLVPIGRPIANIQIYILDANHTPTPLGIPGELCIAGVGLARGYLNRPELTQEKFIESKLFGKLQRLYKTGDLARWLPDGSIEYLGRLDHQVKLRGFRIELSEIEITLTQHEAVKEVVVVLYNLDSNPRLVAYITLAMPIDEEVSSVLRAWLKTRLPEYMLPASITVLDKLPLTPNGKIDRRALTTLSVDSYHVSSNCFVAPRTNEEKLLADIWADVLNMEQIGIHDDFFERGGHSLLATQLMSQIRKTFDVELSLRQLFETPTIAELIVPIETMMKMTQKTTVLSQDREQIKL
jgi:amino acid adenylation domain-containing protein/non-ribosomal peptide synthase protein (TIGR01720 family)